MSSIEIIRYGEEVINPETQSVLMEGSDGNFYAISHVDRDKFVDVIATDQGQLLSRVPSPREIVYGYAVAVSERDESLRIQICSKSAEGAMPISRWTRF